MTILAILSRVPYPLEKGDKLRAFNLLKQLSKSNKIILFCLSDKAVHADAVSQLSEFCDSVHIYHISIFSIIWGVILSFFKGLPLQTGYFYNYFAKKKLKQIVDETKPEHIFCQLLRVAEYVKNFDIPKTIDYQDVFSKGMQRRAEVSSWFLKPLFLLEYKRLFKYENKIFEIFDNKLIISEPDRVLIPHPEKKDIIVIPNGIDTEYFKPNKVKKEFDILFTGNMSYLPNVIGAEMLALEILPLLHIKKPDIKLLLAGANPASRVKALQNDKIFISGWVDDIRECYNKSSIFVAPMMIGTGLQNKLLEAMAMGLPCITTSLANEALGAKENFEILVSNTPKEFAENIIKLMDNVEYADTIAKAGQSYVINKYRWDLQANIINEILIST